MTIRTIIIAIAFLIPISAGAQTEVSCTAVHDSNETRIGRWQGGAVHFENQGVLVRLDVGRSGFGGSEILFFTEPDCSGDIYMHADNPGDFFARHRIVGDDVWHVDPADAGVDVLVESLQFADGDCINGALLGDGVPAHH